MVEAVPGRLHLLPAHGGHIEAAPGRPHRFAGLHLVRRGDCDLLCPLRLQELRHLGEPEAVTVMGGVFPILMKHHDVRHGQGMSVEVCRAIDVEPGINAFQIVPFRQRGGIDQLIVCRIHGKAIAPDRIQRLKAVIQCFIPAL